MEAKLNDANAPKKSARTKTALREEMQRSWQEENRGAIEEYNRRIEAHGVFSDGLRGF